MSDPIVFVLLFAALAIGFALGRLPRGPGRLPQQQSSSWLKRNYYVGLNQLLNDEPDAAVDTFISALEVNSETLETHLALGALLRRRGETARAIRVHQNLLARPSLPRPQLQLAQLELGVDFLKAGLLDRAESLFKELADAKHTEKKVREQALSYLVELYRETSDWLDAIDVADRLTSRKFASTADNWREMQAHFSCELAEKALANNQVLEARRLLRNALRFDKQCARAQLMQAQIELNDGAAAAALGILKKLPYQSPQVISEALPLMRECYIALKSDRDYLQLLNDIHLAQPSLMLLWHLTCATEKLNGPEDACRILYEGIAHYPEMVAVQTLLTLCTAEPASEQIPYEKLKPAITQILDNYFFYICSTCGFTAQANHWLCPSCRSWGKMGMAG